MKIIVNKTCIVYSSFVKYAYLNLHIAKRLEGYTSKYRHWLFFYLVIMNDFNFSLIFHNEIRISFCKQTLETLECVILKKAIKAKMYSQNLLDVIKSTNRHTQPKKQVPRRPLCREHWTDVLECLFERRSIPQPLGHWPWVLMPFSVGLQHVDLRGRVPGIGYWLCYHSLFDLGQVT